MSELKTIDTCIPLVSVFVSELSLCCIYLDMTITSCVYRKLINSTLIRYCKASFFNFYCHIYFFHLAKSGLCDQAVTCHWFLTTSLVPLMLISALYLSHINESIHPPIAGIVIVKFTITVFVSSPNISGINDITVNMLNLMISTNNSYHIYI